MHVVASLDAAQLNRIFFDLLPLLSALCRPCDFWGDGSTRQKNLTYHLATNTLGLDCAATFLGLTWER